MRTAHLYVCVALAAATVEAASQSRPAASAGRFVQFAFTPDAHDGITRKAFRGGADVPARVVNRALVSSIDSLGTSSFPADGGLRAGAPVGPVDFIAEGGDVCNREEVVDGKAIEAAATCWPEFVEDYSCFSRSGRIRARAWMAEDLALVPDTTPVMIVVHDPPDPDSRHFRNPNGRHDVSGSDRFENLLSDEPTDAQGSPALEQFLAVHRNVTAYTR